ncbi:hypothetical protein C6341_g1345 [Phytophthora cactorum]|nr:hypothetical protein C6341_g1345 [Phytophthora cactorum]
MNTPGEKTFKQLWREFCKEGWKPRKPFGMAKDHRYVKPGVKGRFDESKRGVDYFDGGCNAMRLIIEFVLIISYYVTGLHGRVPVTLQGLCGVDTPWLHALKTNQ